MIKNVTVGADPELFLEKNGTIISAEGHIGGSKKEPKEIGYKGHYIQEDNVMIEFNIPPCNTKKDFLHSINYVKEYLDVLVKLKGFNLNFSASANLKSSELNTEQAKEFGCDPDYNVYMKTTNTPPEPGGTLRCCGGHIHIGFDNPSIDKIEKLVYALDITLGLDSLILDKDTKRRTMYGKAGSFRFKDYGLEYRTLSNFWIQNDKSIEWVYDRVMQAVELVNSNQIDNLIKNYAFEIKKTIDKNDIENSIKLSIEINNKIKEKVK